MFPESNTDPLNVLHFLQEKAIKDRAKMEADWPRYRDRPHEHVDSGWGCLVDHGDGTACYRCALCGAWVGH